MQLATTPQPQATPSRMSSREVAEITGKQHAHIMRDIREMCAALAQSKTGFCCESAQYSGENGQLYDMYELDKETSICLLTGYDAVSRMKVVQRWQVLESAQITIPKTLSQALLLAAQQAEQVEQLQLQIAEAQPAKDFYEAVGKCDDAMPVAEAAKLLGIGSITLFSFLRSQKLFMNGTGGQTRNMPYQRGIDAGWFTVIEQTWTAPDGAVHTHTKPLFFQKGLEYIKKLLSVSA